MFESSIASAGPGARIHIRTPHFSSVLAYSDPTHAHYFSAAGDPALAEPRFAHYSAGAPPGGPRDARPVAALPRAGDRALANRWPMAYETYLAFRFPAMNIRAEFEVLK